MEMHLTVLLVEDEILIAMDLEERLLEAGMKVVRATHGEQAVQLALRELPDIVVLDLGLPDIPGSEVLRRLRAEGLNVPIIVLTGMRDSGLRRSVKEYGVSAYLEKPFDHRVLIARIGIIAGPIPNSPETRRSSGRP